MNAQKLHPSPLIQATSNSFKIVKPEPRALGIRVLGAYRGDASGYYRIAVPFSVLRYRTANQFDIGSPTPESAEDYDVLWLQQHADPIAEIVVREFHQRGKLVVYDVDDWLFGVPASWPCYDHYFKRGAGETRDRLRFHERLLNLADVITCPTEYLAARLHSWLGDSPGEIGEGNKRIVVLPNYVLRGDWDTIVPMEHGLNGPVLGWFGTENHWDDWAEIVSAVDQALEDVGGYLALFGATELISMFPERLAERTLMHPAVAMNRFGEIRELLSACDVGLAWCTDWFESCKCRSPLKALQYGAAGLPVVASRTVYGEIPGFADDFGRVVDDPDDLAQALFDTLNEHKDALQRWGQIWQAEVWQNHTYEQQAMRWLRLLEEIC